MKELSSLRFLAVYSGAVTAVLMALLLSGFTPARKKGVFDEIEVKRINLVEPDGTLRMVVSDKAMFPGAIMRGKEYPFQRSGTGLLFYNDEGTENGGLIFGGAKGKDGNVSAGGRLTFDQYEQDQVVQLWQYEDKGRRAAGLVVNDRPDKHLDFEAERRLTTMPEGPERAKLKADVDEANKGVQRVFLGKREDRSAELVMKDQHGRKRVIMRVSAEGAPSLEFFDENGKVTASFPQVTR